MIVWQFVWWWVLIGACYLAMEWEYGGTGSFVHRMVRHEIPVYGRYVRIVLNAGTFLAAIVVWPRLAWFQLKEQRPDFSLKFWRRAE